MSAAYLGDYAEDATIKFFFSTSDLSGGATNLTSNGTISVYKGTNSTQTTAGISFAESPDSVVGVHACTIDLSSDAFYATGYDYSIVLAGAGVAGQTVNAVLAYFSIQNRYMRVTNSAVTSLSTVATKASQTEMMTTVDTILTDTNELQTNQGDWATSTLTESGIADAIADEAFEGSMTLRQAVRVILGVLAGKTSGGGTNRLTFRNMADTSDRLAATVDASKNRTGITLTLD